MQSIQSHPTICSLCQKFENARARYRLYGLLVVGLFLLAWITVAFKAHRNHEAMDFVVSDGEGYWLYLPSLVIDHNLRFTNALEFHETVHPVFRSELPDTPFGIRNKYPSGIAMSVAPAFLVAHGIALASSRLWPRAFLAPNGYSIPYQFCCLGMMLAIAWLSLVMIDGVLARRFRLSGSTIAAAVILYTTGSSWAYYHFREPFMAHGLAAAWVIFSIALADRIADDASHDQPLPWWSWPLLTFTFSMASICRLTNGIVFLPLIIWPAIATLRSHQTLRLLKCIPLMVLAAFPVITQLIVMHLLAPRNVGQGVSRLGYGAYERFNWLHPALPQTLFSDFHGLFFWSPILLLSVWGVAHRLRTARSRPDGLLVALAVSLLALWYLNSAWWCWPFSKAFGARAFVDYSGGFIIGLGLGLDSIFAQGLSWKRRASVYSFIAFALLVNWTLLVLFVSKKIPSQQSLWGKTPDLRQPSELLPEGDTSPRTSKSMLR